MKYLSAIEGINRNYLRPIEVDKLEYMRRSFRRDFEVAFGLQLYLFRKGNDGLIFI